jgi:regulator of replication initiation timing
MMTLVEKLDALQEQQSEISALAVKVHILATALNDEDAALRAENERLRTVLRAIAVTTPSNITCPFCKAVGEVAGDALEEPTDG